MAHSTAANPRRRGTTMWLVASFTLLATSLSVGGQLGAQTGCGEYSFSFEGTRLLNDGISDRAGPFAIDLPAGTYTVTLLAHDHHDSQVGVGTQPGEQFHVILDSGYVSGDSIDIPDDENTTTTTFSNQQIAASTQISVEHGGVPGINSVNPVCVGFTPSEAAADATEDEPDPADDPPAAQPAEQPTVSDEPSKGEPDAEAVGADPIDPDDEIEVEVEGIVEFPTEQPIQELVPPVSIVRSDVEVAGPDVVEVAVLDATAVQPESEAAQSDTSPPASALAATGAGSVSQLLVMIGAVLLALGALCLRWARYA